MRLAAVTVAAACMSGCGIYLHDSGLETATTTLATTYGAADPRVAMSKFVERQRALDEAEVAALMDNEAAARDRAVADLLTARGQSQPGVERLRLRVDTALTRLTGRSVGDGYNWATLIDNSAKAQLVSSSLDLNRRRLAEAIAAYDATAVKPFGRCTAETLQTLPPGSKLYLACGTVLIEQRDITLFENLADDAAMSGSALRLTIDDLAAVDAELKTAKAAGEAATQALKTAKKAADEAAKRPTAEARVSGELTDLHDLIDKYTKQLSQVDDAAALGEALAAIKFKEVSLAEILAAKDEGDTLATQRRKQVVGVVAGFIKINEAGKTPSTAELAIALAAQRGIAQTAEVRLDSLKARRDLLVAKRAAQVRELEQLAQAKVALGGIAVSPPGCGDYGLGSVLRSATCSQAVRDNLELALTAYAMSWAAGHTPARAAGLRADHQIAWLTLRTQEEALKARVETQVTAMSQLQAAGAAGVKPQDIAALLNALGVTAIAIGVN